MKNGGSLFSRLDNRHKNRVRYKVTVSKSYRFWKLSFFQVESYRCPKVTVFLGWKLPFIVKKLPFLVIKLPFISESYRFEFSLKLNGNFDTDKVTVYWYRVTVF